MEEKDEITNYIKAGKIAREALEVGRGMIKPGARLFEMAEQIEAMIINEGAELAFPVNISVNEQAAHFTPSLNEEIQFSDDDLVKLDIGVHVNGFIGDTACTVDLSGKNQKLVEASEKALENAISMIKAGAISCDIGEEIEKTIEGFGFKPVRNLGGHILREYELHGDESLPNCGGDEGWLLEEGMAIAIEPFASTGDGHVKEGTRTDIFGYSENMLVRNTGAREILEYARVKYKSLPFCERWLAKKWPEFQLKIGLRDLIRAEAFVPYPVLRDIDYSLVSQAEHTVIVEKDGCKITTKI
ncbi:MAG: type II methionyl aminopeptidase [Candidatus Micrarchaeota archaeon]